MNKSEQINDLAAALCKAQGSIKAALKSSDNPFFKSKYADLSAVWDACKEPLAKNGLAISQHPASVNGEVQLETMLLHTSGQWISSTLTMKPTKTDPQSFGSCVTYARRYALAAIVGVVTEDDDGNAASQDHHENGRAAPKQSPASVARAANPKVQLADAIAEFSGFAKNTSEFKDACSKLIAVAGGGKINTPMEDADAEKVLAFVTKCQEEGFTFEKAYAGEVKP